LKIPLQSLNNETRGSLKDPLSCLAVFVLVTGAVALVRGWGLPLGPVLIPALWGLGAVFPLRRGDGDLLAFGVKGPALRKNLRYFLLSSLAVFPLYAAGFFLLSRWGFLLPDSGRLWGASFYDWLFYNFLAIALFEELFFRGFVQGRFENYSRKRFHKTGAVFFTPILVSAFLFALAHVAADLDPARIVVFFPGLLFASLRAKTGTLLAPILSHGTANLVSAALMEWVS